MLILRSYSRGSIMPLLRALVLIAFVLLFRGAPAMAQEDFSSIERKSCDGAPPATMSTVLEPFPDWLQEFCPPIGHILAPPNDANGKPRFEWINVTTKKPFVVVAGPVSKNPKPEDRDKYYFRIPMASVVGDRHAKMFDDVYRELAKRAGITEPTPYDEAFVFNIWLSVGPAVGQIQPNLLVFYLKNRVPHHVVYCLVGCQAGWLMEVRPTGTPGTN